MKTAVIAILAAALAALAGAAAAQTLRHEVSVFGSWDDMDEPSEVETFSLNLRYGYFVSQRLVATGTLSRNSVETNTSDTSSTTFLVGAKYYFSDPRAQALVPFVDGGIGFANVDNGNDNTDLAWEFGGGVAMFITERTSFDAALRLYNTDTDARTKGLRAFIGITTRF